MKVGSIVFLAEHASTHARSLRLSELLLLILRCLLLIFLALLLSKPVWIRPPAGSKEKGWILISQQHSKEIYTHFKPYIDSLLNNGFRLHRLQSPFEAASLADSALFTGDASYWKMIRQLNQYLPSHLPVHVFTDNTANNFVGSRPQVSLHLNWHIYTPTDSASGTEKIFSTASDSIRIITAHSKAGGHWFSYANMTTGSMQADTAIFRVCVYTDQYNADAHYVQAAFNAIRDFTQQRIQTIIVSDTKQITDNADWLFWLSDKPLPGNLSAKNIFAYEAGKSKTTNTAMLVCNKRFELYRQIEADNKLHPLWINGHGETILGRDDEKSIYHFYNRFHPQWNSMVWDESFPSLIYELVWGDTKTISGPYSKLAIDEKQVMPVVVAQSTQLPKAQLHHPINLSRIFWILVCLLLLIERLIAHYSKRSTV